MSIFNFQVYNYFDLQACDHASFIESLSLNTDINTFGEPLVLEWQHPETPEQEKGGIMLTLSTYPGEHYHLCARGRLLLGDKVSLLIKSAIPEFNLISAISWELGSSEWVHIPFQAVHAKTLVLIYTDFPVGLSVAPYQFYLSQLQIIPDCLTCPSFFELLGPPGPTGVQGSQGLTGPIGPTKIGPPGPTGGDGATGPVGGLFGPIGSPGPTSILIGPFGPPGPSVTGPEGSAGPPGAFGMMGPLGDQGLVGLPGVTGLPGVDQFILVETDQLLTWSGQPGFPDLVAIVACYQLAGQRVTWWLPEFNWTTNPLPITSYVLVTNDLPMEVQPVNQIWLPILLEVGGVLQVSSLKIQGSSMEINSGLALSFSAGESVKVFSQSLSYLL